MKKNNIDINKVLGTLTFVVAFAFLIGGLVLLFHPSTKTKLDTQIQDRTTVVGTSEAVTTQLSDVMVEETVVEGFTEVQIEQNFDESEPTETETQVNDTDLPLELKGFLNTASCSEETLYNANTSQLVVIKSSGTSAQILYYEKNGEKWICDDSLTCSGYVGAEGTVTYMSEQISGTPKGFYPIGEAFYQYNAPDTGLKTFQVTSDTYWVDDPDSKYYNQRVEGVADKDWNSAEHMMSISNYKYGFVVNYNMPAEYNKGSAIFFHIGYSPTLGCIATSENMVLAYLSRLNAENNPYILVI